MTGMADIANLIKVRMELADKNKTNYVYFTPQQRKDIVKWLKEKTGVKSLKCKDCGYNESCEITHLDDNPVCENFTLMN